MNTFPWRWTLIPCIAVLCASCAVSPEEQYRQQAREDEIAAILSMPLDESEHGKPRRCLSGHEYRTFRALDDRRLLFEGPRDKLWLNTLRNRCPDLEYANVLRVRSTVFSTRICDGDTFAPTDWFAWPWYRRWPWYWDNSWGSGIRCSLGMFQPVTADQVSAINNVLNAR